MRRQSQGLRAGAGFVIIQFSLVNASEPRTCKPN